MNAVLQSLLSLETFVSDMNRDEFIQALPYTSFYQALLQVSETASSCVSPIAILTVVCGAPCVVWQIAVEMRREKHGIINPWPVKDAVARMAKQFSDWMQQVLDPILANSSRQQAGD